MELAIEQLLEIENDPQILKFRFTYKDTLMWPFVRWNVLHTLEQNRLFSNRLPKTSKKTIDINMEAGWKRFLSIIAKNPFFSGRNPILFIYGCTGNVLDENGYIHNRIFDDYVNLYPDSTYVLEESDRDIIKKSEITRHYLSLFDFIINRMVEKQKPDPKDINMVNSFFRYLKKNVPAHAMTSEQTNCIRSLILYYSIKIKYQDIFYHLLFQWVRPKVVFIEDGCYGERNAYLCRILGEMGIISAEIQHGWVGRQHIAYNYSKYIKQNSEYKKYMPDYFCGMADYWLEQINAPVKKICFGNPGFWIQYDKFCQESKEEKNRDKKTILWLEFDDDKQNMELLTEFAEKSDCQYEIILRIHPTYKGKREINYRNLMRNCPNFFIDASQTVYEAFAKCDYVIADFSTAIYEALAFGKKVFVFKNKLSCYYDMVKVAIAFENIKELIFLLEKNKSCNMRTGEWEKEKFFVREWEKNYKTFVKRYIS